MTIYGKDTTPGEQAREVKFFKKTFVDPNLPLVDATGKMTCRVGCRLSDAIVQYNPGTYGGLAIPSIEEIVPDTGQVIVRFTGYTGLSGTLPAPYSGFVASGGRLTIWAEKL